MSVKNEAHAFSGEGEASLPGWVPLALFVAFVVAATSGIFSFGVQDNNEGLYATIAKEMLASGQWVVPHLNGVVYLEKPPLLYWMVAGSLAVFGSNEVAVRLVPVFFMGLTVLGLLRLFTQMGRRQTGYMAAAMLVSTGGFVVMSRSLLFDVPMTSFLVWSLVFFHAWRTGGERRQIWFFYVCLALAVMAKGPTALVLGGGCAVVATLLMDRSARSVLRIFDPAGILIFFIITVPWHIWAEVRHPGFAHFYFINEHILRFLNLRQPQDYYSGPFYYYLVRLPLYLGLWTLFLPLLWWRGKGKGAASGNAEGSGSEGSASADSGARRPAGDSAASAARPLAVARTAGNSGADNPETPSSGFAGSPRAFLSAEQQGRVLLWVAVLLPLIFFSVSRAKANYYWLPSIPALLGLLALAWPSALNAWSGLRWVRWVAFALLGLALVALVALPIVPHAVTIPAPWDGFTGSGRTLLTMTLLALAAVGAVWSLRRIGPQGTFLCICAGGLVPWLAAPRALSLADAEISNRQVAQFIKEEPACTVVFFRDYEYMSSLGFYLDAPVPIVNCHSNDLYYARHLQVYPQTFIDDSALKAKAAQGRVYLVMRNSSRGLANTQYAAAGFSELRSFRRLTVFTNAPVIGEALQAARGSDSEQTALAATHAVGR